MKKIMQIPFSLRGIQNNFEVIYKENTSALESGFDALDLPFNPNLCLGYPEVHAYFGNMKSSGYRRSCGWIQIVHREYYSSIDLSKPDENELSIDTNDPDIIYLAFGSPAELYDAPCNNLNGNCKGKWTAYTYLVDLPSRMNDNQLSFLAGFKWGYEEELKNGSLSVKMLDIEEIDNKQWKDHIKLMKKEFPKYNYK